MTCKLFRDEKGDFSRESGYDGTRTRFTSLGCRFSHDPMVAV